jgi:hypothetical protein
MAADKRNSVFEKNRVSRVSMMLVLALALALAILALGLALACTRTVQAQEAGILEGQVVNGTAGGPQVGAGITVTLHVNQGDTELKSLETTTTTGGRFRFEGLDTDAALAYWPEAVYLGVPYRNAEPYQFTAGQTQVDASLTVYETTGDGSAIRLDSVHVIVESFEQVLRVSEIHFFGNSGDRTYVGRNGQTVFIPLPAEAVGLAFEEETPGERFVEVQGGVMDTAPVPPGTETSLAFFSYHLVPAGNTVPLERSFAYPVADLNILAAQPGLTLQSDQLQAAGTRSFQDQQYELYTGQDLSSDTPLAVTFSLVPAAAGSSSVPEAAAPAMPGAAPAPGGGNQRLLRWLGAALSGLAVVAAVIYPLVARQKGPAPASAPKLAKDPQARQLLAELAALEEAFEAGQIDEEAYARRRAGKYEALKAL